MSQQNMFDMIKARFYQKETQLNTEEELKELAEKEKQAREAAELKKQQEEEER